LLARFGLVALRSANGVARSVFRTPHTKALFAGLAAHSFLSLDDPLSASFALVLGAAAHAVGWPIPRGGAQSITNALCGHLVALGGRLNTSSRVEHVAELRDYDLAMFDVTPRQLERIVGEKLSPGY